MFNSKKLEKKHFSECYNTLSKDFNDLKYFNKIGWTKYEFKKQFDKDINFSIGLFKNNKIYAFILGDLKTIEKKSEYEILMVYVTTKSRKKGFATKLINDIPIYLDSFKLTNIYLEVAENNIEAINLYKKNLFKEIGVRKNYYYHSANKRLNAFLLNKKIND